ncbi:MAG: putative Dihydrodipicolinate synthase [Acidimicrobiales bacterium]|nr:putative Dihydrodipicolinate synthase [Acidimicrobiales bacterium]
MAAPVFAGSGVALLTLFDDDGRLLPDLTAELAQSLFAKGITAFLVAGTAGEFFLLEDDERIELVDVLRSSLPAPATVLAHVGGVPGERAEAMAAAAVGAGADAIVALPLGIDDQRRYYAGIVAAVPGTPVLAYHLPQAGVSIPVDLLPELGVDAVKDSEGDVARLTAAVRGGIEVYTGAPDTLVAMHDLGAPGTLVGLANSHPTLTIAAFSGDRHAQDQLDALEPASLDDFPTGLKTMTGAHLAIPTGSRGKARPGLRSR